MSYVVMLCGAVAAMVTTGIAALVSYVRSLVSVSLPSIGCSGAESDRCCFLSANGCVYRSGSEADCCIAPAGGACKARDWSHLGRCEDCEKQQSGRCQVGSVHPEIPLFPPRRTHVLRAS